MQSRDDAKTLSAQHQAAALRFAQAVEETGTSAHFRTADIVFCAEAWEADGSFIKALRASRTIKPCREHEDCWVLRQPERFLHNWRHAKHILADLFPGIWTSPPRNCHAAAPWKVPYPFKRWPDHQGLLDAWDRWCEHFFAIKGRKIGEWQSEMMAYTLSQQLNSPEKIIECLDFSIERGAVNPIVRRPAQKKRDPLAEI